MKSALHRITLSSKRSELDAAAAAAAARFDPAEDLAEAERQSAAAERLEPEIEAARVRVQRLAAGVRISESAMTVSRVRPKRTAPIREGHPPRRSRKTMTTVARNFYRGGD